jgi:hypothetical protein
VALGPSGQRVVTEAKAVLAALDALAEPDTSPPNDHPFTVGVLGFSLAESWSTFLELVDAQLNGVALAYRDLTFTDQYAAIQSHQVDAGIVQYVGPVDGLELTRVRPYSCSD